MPSRDDRGTASVEFGLVSFVLGWLLIAVVILGNMLLNHQKAYEFDSAATAPAGSYLSCGSLVDVVRASVIDNVNQQIAAEDRATGGAVSLAAGEHAASLVNASDVTVSVVGFTPGHSGVDVRIDLRVPGASNAITDLAGSGRVMAHSVTHLDEVVLETASC